MKRLFIFALAVLTLSLAGCNRKANENKEAQTEQTENSEHHPIVVKLIETVNEGIAAYENEDLDAAVATITKMDEIGMNANEEERDTLRTFVESEEGVALSEKLKNAISNCSEEFINAVEEKGMEVLNNRRAETPEAEQE